MKLAGCKHKCQQVRKQKQMLACMQTTHDTTLTDKTANILNCTDGSATLLCEHACSPCKDELVLPASLALRRISHANMPKKQLNALPFCRMLCLHLLPGAVMKHTLLMKKAHQRLRSAEKCW